MQEEFNRLGRRLAAEFARCNNDHREFPRLAYEALSTVSLPAVDYPGLLALLLDPALPAQRLDDRFSDLPVVLYHDAHFRIDLLCWLNASTSIHQHGFSGAFRVWQGSSVHTRYQFTETHRHSTYLRLGQVECLDCELLEAGAVREINAGAGLTHAVFHLDAPTYSLVARTHSEPWNGPQLTLAPPVVAYEPTALRQQLEPVQQLLKTMLQVGQVSLLPAILAHLPAMDFAVVAVLGGWWMQLARHEGCADEFQDAVARYHGETLAAALPHAAWWHGAERQGHHLRARFDDTDLRFFVAALMNAPNREALDRLLAQRYPRTPARTVILAALSALLSSGELAVTLQGEAVTRLTSVLVDADDGASFLTRLRREHPDIIADFSPAEVMNLYHRIRAIPILGVLFR